MKIICLGCGHRLDLYDAYGDYDGLIKCNVCRKLMSIVTKEGKLQSSRLQDDANAIQDRKHDKGET